MEPYRELVELLDPVPGVDEVVAWTVIAELGSNTDVFPTAAHVGSWAGLCPGTKESARKQLSTKTRKGNRYLKRVLLEAAWSATNKKNSYLRAFFHCLQYRRGWGKAIVDLAHKLLVIICDILKTKTPYYELGADYYDRLHPEKTVHKLVQRLQRLGMEVTVQPQVVQA